MSQKQEKDMNNSVRLLQSLGLALLIALSLLACTASKENEAIKIVCTTGMLADAAQQIVGDFAEVEALMGPGVDPHLYKATQGDLQKFNQASLIIYNGLHLEGKMGEVLEKMARIKPVVAAGEGLGKERIKKVPGTEDIYDPHIWFDVALWSETVAYMTEELAKQFPQQRSQFEQNAAAYRKQLDSLHQTVAQQILSIPSEQRVLVTAHDAFTYFGDAYGIEVRGLQGISTLSEFGLKDVSDLVDFIVARKIKAVFVETSVSDKALQAVIQGCTDRGHPVRIGGSLYSDAMGAKGTPEGTYIGMVNANVSKIVEALK
ncbi:zinc ABC transporter substrate-binding protein [Cytophagales bacterium LB-30]|uniref:Zinc ABC transporter substrate-binding protein n=1 Tax=Shiella aurantiaca TaxID=3058365 RepID=A0ABT8F0Z0_9BACT|nr:zinc ABC transporter substrate-binding protein [Shiella aurantiaca]MDN4164115.1 zinc ABC transporter substrate-binding protein [Shiella aurantiaca]